MSLLNPSAFLYKTCSVSAREENKDPFDWYTIQSILFMTYITSHTIISQKISGGEHYQGMAELLQKQRSTVDISKMTGRNDNMDPFEAEQGTMGQALELNTVDPKPNMPRSKGFLFSDPDQVPRFHDLTFEGSSRYD